MRRLGLALLVTLALGAGACGGGGGDKSNDAVKASDTATGALSKIAAGAVGDVCGSKAAVAVGAAFASAYQNSGADYASEADALQKAADAAPAEIKDDFHTVADALAPFLKALNEAHGDFAKLATSQEFKDAGEKLDSEQYKTAAENIDKWFGEHCK